MFSEAITDFASKCAFIQSKENMHTRSLRTRMFAQLREMNDVTRQYLNRDSKLQTQS